MIKTMRILLAEQDKDFIGLLESSLNETGGCYLIEAVPSGEECLQKLESGQYDILLLDHILADGEGLAWLKEINRRNIRVPTVFVTAKGDVRMSVEAMGEGVFDYINRSAECAKAFPFVVNRVVQGYNLMIEKVRLNRELIETRNFLESVLENAGDAITVADDSGRIIYWNRGAERIYGWSKEESLGRGIADLLLPAAEAGPVEEKLCRDLNDLNERVLKGEVVVNAEAPRITKDGREIITQMTASPLTNAAGEIIGITRICKDLTQIKRAEEKLVLAERLSSMGELIAGVAHEIRNPLAGIKINAQILARKKDLPELEKKIVASTLEGIGKIQKIVEDMLDYARPKAARYRNEELNPLVEKSLDVLRSKLKKANIVTRLDLGQGLPPVRIDAHQIQQVLINILINAIQAMEDGGFLTVRTYATKKGEAAVEIEDTGPGIPAAHLKRIFDPFFTTKSRGTGLGLSISMKLLENHRAALEAASEEGRGARFTIRIPAAESEGTAFPEEAGGRELRGEK